MNKYNIQKIVKSCCITVSFIAFLALISFTSAHEGEPEHGGDLPINLGGNRMQYEGQQYIVDIEIRENAFHPAEVTVDTGAIVAFKNLDVTEHRLVFNTDEWSTDAGNHNDVGEYHDHPIGAGHESFNLVKPGDYWVLQFLVSGVFRYKCSIHGVSGQIYVRY